MLTDFKTPCTIDVRTRNAQSGPLDSVAHIFEYRYSEKTVFWFGTAEVPLSPQKYYQLITSDAPEFLRYHLKLPDGRAGGATFYGTEGESCFAGENAGDFLRINFHGEMQLALPREPRGDQITIIDELPDDPERPGFSAN